MVILDHVEGKRSLDTILSLNPVTMDTVCEISAAAWINVLGASIPLSAWGGDQAVSFRNLSPSVLKSLARQLKLCLRPGKRAYNAFT